MLYVPLIKSCNLTTKGLFNERKSPDMTGKWLSISIIPFHIWVLMIVGGLVHN